MRTVRCRILPRSSLAIAATVPSTGPSRRSSDAMALAGVIVLLGVSRSFGRSGTRSSGGSGMQIGRMKEQGREREHRHLGAVAAVRSRGPATSHLMQRVSTLANMSPRIHPVGMMPLEIPS
jgi:hypothetical protein